MLALQYEKKAQFKLYLLIRGNELKIKEKEKRKREAKLVSSFFNINSATTNI